MQDNKYIALGVVISLLIVGSIVFVAKFMNPNDNIVAPPSTVPQPVGVTNPPPAPYAPQDGAIQPVIPLAEQADYIVDITPVGFSPDILRVKKGNSVIWTSRDKYNSHQIVSTGTKYPGMDSPPLKLGESWRVTFNTVGTWTYQDKLHPNLKGTIIVE